MPYRDGPEAIAARIAALEAELERLRGRADEEREAEREAARRERKRLGDEREHLRAALEASHAVEREILRRRSEDEIAGAAERADVAQMERQLTMLELERLVDRVATMQREIDALLDGPAEAMLHYRARIAVLEAAIQARSQRRGWSTADAEDTRELERLKTALQRLGQSPEGR